MAGKPSFSRDVAPIIFKNCAYCHRPGQSAPFDLLRYEDVRKHAKQIVEVTGRRYMPPWLPEPGFGQFAQERRLSSSELKLIEEWVAAGTPLGESADLSTVPKWPGEWQLGQPDLLVEVPTPYTLSAEGKDVYRNFVVSVALTSRRYIRAVEFRPGNPRIVHHAFVKVDPTRQSRALEASDGQPGFGGMNTPESVQMPEGHFLTWQPGKLPTEEPPGLSWVLNPGDDLVLQLHLRPTGKPESIQPKVGLYFTDVPPTNACFKLVLTSLALDIPPGHTNYEVKDEFKLPVDLEVLAVLPHAHYLCHEMQSWATLPDGTRKWLLWIKDWDFNWQGDYRYSEPVFLPRGTTLFMRYTYDNSTNNIANPNHPPKRVTYGAQSTDEMAELWFQVLPRNRADLSMLSSHYSGKMLGVLVDYNRYLLRLNPGNVRAHVELAVALMGQDQFEEARGHLHAATQLNPKDDEPWYQLGLLSRRDNKLDEARHQFQIALDLNPSNSKAHGNLGVIYAEQGKLDLAESQFKTALRINPQDAMAQECLRELQEARATKAPAK